jgi:hypothetical protein
VSFLLSRAGRGITAPCFCGFPVDASRRRQIRTGRDPAPHGRDYGQAFHSPVLLQWPTFPTQRVLRRYSGIPRLRFRSPSAAVSVSLSGLLCARCQRCFFRPRRFFESRILLSTPSETSLFERLYCRPIRVHSLECPRGGRRCGDVRTFTAFAAQCAQRIVTPVLSRRLCSCPSLRPLSPYPRSHPACHHLLFSLT